MWLLHTAAIITGTMAAHMFFQGTLLYLICLAILTYSLLFLASLAKLKGQNGILVSVISLVFLLTW